MAESLPRKDRTSRVEGLPAARHLRGTEERLRCVTSHCVLFMVRRGWDAWTIRSWVLTLAKGVIQDLADDEYQAETHTAIVQRTVDDPLGKLLDAPTEGSDDACRAR